MVNPKKDYELLMRYLQRGATKRESATVPEQTCIEDWPPAPNPDPLPIVDTNTLVSGKRHHNVQFPTFKLPKISLPRWQSLSLWKRVRIATAVLAFAILLFVTWKAYTFFTLTPDSIYNKIYVPYENNNGSAVVRNSIEQYYWSGNYVAAALKAKKQKQLSDKEKLLTGLSYFQRDDYTNAIKWLEPSANNFKSPYRQQAEFYLALSFLKNEDFDRCIVRMEHIAYTPSNPYHDRISSRTISDVKMLKWK